MLGIVHTDTNEIESVCECELFMKYFRHFFANSDINIFFQKRLYCNTLE